MLTRPNARAIKMSHVNIFQHLCCIRMKDEETQRSALVEWKSPGPIMIKIRDNKDL